jgi:hypothetical protein
MPKCFSEKVARKASAMRSTMQMIWFAKNADAVTKC